MDCHKCKKKAVLVLQHGSLCKSHFIDYFEEKVFKTITKYKLLDHKDKICVAASGGKDSLTVLYLTQKYLERYHLPHEQLFALAIDEGIKNYRAKTLVNLKKFCKDQNIKLELVKTKDVFGRTLDQAYPIVNKDTQKKPCNVCGVWRRYLLNKYARTLGANKVVTGHNLDDEAQAIIMNMFKANTSLASHLGPISGLQNHKLFVQRVKPLYFCTEKETRLYTLLKGFQVQFIECPYAKEGYRAQILDMLNNFEEKYKGTKQGIINSFLEILPLLKEKELAQNRESIKECTKCGEPANQDICNACKIMEVLMHEQG